MEKQLVINFFGSPCTGKSTLASWLFSELKSKNVKCEYVTEFAKDMTWENNLEALNYQQYIWGNQSWRMARLKNKVDVIITDSPLPLAIIYNKKRLKEPEFTKLIMQDFNEYNNLNIYLEVLDNYSDVGRNQNKDEAKQIDTEILHLLMGNFIDTRIMRADNPNVRDKILKLVIEKLKEHGKSCEQ